MEILKTLLYILFALFSGLLILFVMIQDDQGEGLGGIFGGGSATPFGSQSGNVLTKVTSVLGVLFFITVFGLAVIGRSSNEGDILGEARKAASEESSENWWETPAEQDDSTGNDVLEIPAEK